ncbi:hypothetical protein HME9302_02264 [Alteripontixanthobacter maritimus]|uniref:Uncharacterized protein n=1 Tax=Alteripontixanthobacter maritimus TaxID=2161824 RepID=A0A369QCT1_9SPHN|nr:hypothetical protein HME9302_02264 [Alteripontixanthobacter maritimus]
MRLHVRWPWRDIHRRRRCNGRRGSHIRSFWFRWRRFILRFRRRRFLDIYRRHPLHDLLNRGKGKAGNQYVADTDMDQRDDNQGNYPVTAHFLVSVGHSVPSLHRNLPGTSRLRTRPGTRQGCHNRKFRRIPPRYRCEQKTEGPFRCCRARRNLSGILCFVTPRASFLSGDERHDANALSVNRRFIANLLKQRKP